MAHPMTTEYQNENRHLIASGDFLCPKGGAFHLEVKINKEIRNYTDGFCHLSSSHWMPSAQRLMTSV